MHFSYSAICDDPLSAATHFRPHQLQFEHAILFAIRFLIVAAFASATSECSEPPKQLRTISCVVAKKADHGSCAPIQPLAIAGVPVMMDQRT